MIRSNLATTKLNNSHAAGYLGIRKFHLLLLASTIDAVQVIIMGILDKLIVGNLIGPDAVAGISLLSPMDTILMMFEYLFSTGAAVMYARAIADYDENRARKVEGMTIFLTLVFSFILVILSFTGENAYFATLSASGPALEYAKQYFYFSRFRFIFTPLSTLLGAFVLVDGNEKLVMWTTVCEMAGDFVLSIILCLTIGVSGAALGNILSSSFTIIALLIHFFRPSNKRRPMMHFSLRETLEVITIGASDSISLLFDAGYEMFIKIWFIRHFGMEHLAVLVAVSAVSDLLFLGDGTSSSINMMILAYRGDGNQYAIRNLMHHAARISLYISLGFIVIICSAARLIPVMFGIRDPHLISLAATGCRIESVEILAYIFISVLSTYYVSISRYGLAIAANALNSLIVRVPLVVIFTQIAGMNGVWIGSGLTSGVSLGVLALIVTVLYGRDKFPLIDIDKTTESINVSFPITVEEAVGASRTVEKFLSDHDVNPVTTVKAVLAIEEVPLLVAEINKDSEIVKNEGIHIDTFTAIEKEGIRVIFWYDGTLTDAADPEQMPGSLRGYLVAGLMGNVENRNYLPTAGYNRISFMIPYSRTE